MKSFTMIIMHRGNAKSYYHDAHPDASLGHDASMKKFQECISCVRNFF